MLSIAKKYFDALVAIGQNGVFFALVGLCLSTPSSLFATDYYLITNTGTSAEMIGIGHVEGFSQSPSSLFENPASLSEKPRLAASAFQATLINEVKYLGLNTAGQISPKLWAGVGFFETLSDGFDITSKNSNGRVIGTGDKFSVRNTVIKAGLAYKQRPNLYWGVAATHYQNKIYTTHGNGLDFDLGLRFKKDDKEYALAAKNILGSTVSYNNDGSETLPRQFIASSWWKLSKIWHLYGQIKSENTHLGSSVGVKYYPLGHSLLGLSMGLRNFKVFESEKSALSMGVSMKVNGLQVDAAFNKSEYVGEDNKFFVSLHVPINNKRFINTPISNEKIATEPVKITLPKVALAQDTVTPDMLPTPTISKVAITLDDIRNLAFLEKEAEKLSFNPIFDFDAAEVAIKPQELISLKTHLNAHEGLVVVVGHTDNTGPALYNLYLSEKRAESMAKHVSALTGKSNIISYGLGENAPLYNNELPQERRKNRRVDIYKLNEKFELSKVDL